MATGDGKAYFIDTNVLVAAKARRAPGHAAAIQALVHLEERRAVVWISRQVMREYLAALSRPQTFTQPAPAAELVA